MYSVNPRNKSISLAEDRGVAYCSRYIISDNIKYDMENPDSISSMKIPKFNDIHGMPNITFDLGYILKMKANNENRPFLAVPLCYKATNMMLVSPIAWNKKDYYMLIKHLWLIGEIEYADFLENKLKEMLPFMTNDNYVHEQAFYREMKCAKDYNLDLIEICYTGACCNECAKYQGRVYSISGKSKNFPQLPQQIIDNKGDYTVIIRSILLRYTEKRAILKYKSINILKMGIVNLLMLMQLNTVIVLL